MTNQKSRPDSDVSTGDWTPTPIAPEINSESPDDVTKVSSKTNPVSDVFVVKFGDLAWPKTGDQKLRFRLKKSGVGATRCGVQLMQGSRRIAGTLIGDPPSEFTEYEITLTEQEMASITSYIDLRLEVAAMWSCAGTAPAKSVWLQRDGSKVADFVYYEDPGAAPWPDVGEPCGGGNLIDAYGNDIAVGVGAWYVEYDTNPNDNWVDRFYWFEDSSPTGWSVVHIHYQNCDIDGLTCQQAKDNEINPGEFEFQYTYVDNFYIQWSI